MKYIAGEATALLATDADQGYVDLLSVSTCGTSPDVETVIRPGDICRPGCAVRMSSAGITAGRFCSGSPMPCTMPQPLLISSQCNMQATPTMPTNNVKCHTDHEHNIVQSLAAITAGQSARNHDLLNDL